MLLKPSDPDGSPVRSLGRAQVYFANVHPKFPEGGKLTQLLDAMKVGDTIDVKGPLGEWIFHTPLTLPKAPAALPTFVETTTKVETPFDAIGFIAGGSGITPVLQTAHALVADKAAKIQIKILFANRSIEDILCKDLLDALEKDPRVEVWYTLDVQVRRRPPAMHPRCSLLSPPPSLSHLSPLSPLLSPSLPLLRPLVFHPCSHLLPPSLAFPRSPSRVGGTHSASSTRRWSRRTCRRPRRRRSSSCAARRP